MQADDNELDNPTWSLLPEDNLQLVFEHLEICDVEKCLQVCMHWYKEGNFYLKDKIIFNTSRVENIPNAMASRRRFQKIQVKCTDVAILEATNKADPILEASVEYTNYASLSRILRALGKNLKSLDLINSVNPAPLTSQIREDIFNIGLQREHATLDYGYLSSVEDLKISKIDNGLLNISQKFSKLKSLTLESRFGMTKDYLSTILLQDLISCNPLLEKLDLINGNLGLEIEGRPLRVNTLSSFENAINLKELHLYGISHEQDLNDIANFNNLIVLTIGRMEDNYNASCIRKVFRLPNLRSISLIHTDIESDTWKEVFSNLKNFKITHLLLNILEMIEEQALIACTKCFPNIETFICEYNGSFSLTLFKEMSKNWEHLQTLDITLDATNFEFEPSRSNIIGYFAFEKLINLKLTLTDDHYLFLLRLFAYSRAINLKTLDVRLSVRYDEPQNILPQINSFLLQNFPNVECLRLSEDLGDIKEVIQHLPDIKTLHYYWNHDPDTKILNALKYLSSLRTTPMKIVFYVEPF